VVENQAVTITPAFEKSIYPPFENPTAWLARITSDMAASQFQ
jgi:hypothetical protein